MSVFLQTKIKKTMKKILSAGVAIFAALMFTGCYANVPLQRAPARNNDSYEVSYLFEHDGVRVYRFYDDGREVYFTSPATIVTAVQNDSAKTVVPTLILQE